MLASGAPDRTTKPIRVLEPDRKTIVIDTVAKTAPRKTAPMIRIARMMSPELEIGDGKIWNNMIQTFEWLLVLGIAKIHPLHYSAVSHLETPG
jgi:hypothetical protein